MLLATVIMHILLYAFFVDVIYVMTGKNDPLQVGFLHRRKMMHLVCISPIFSLFIIIIVVVNDSDDDIN